MSLEPTGIPTQSEFNTILGFDVFTNSNTSTKCITKNDIIGYTTSNPVYLSFPNASSYTNTQLVKTEELSPATRTITVYVYDDSSNKTSTTKYIYISGQGIKGQNNLSTYADLAGDANSTYTNFKTTVTISSFKVDRHNKIYFGIKTPATKYGICVFRFTSSQTVNTSSKYYTTMVYSNTNNSSNATNYNYYSFDIFDNTSKVYIYIRNKTEISSNYNIYARVHYANGDFGGLLIGTLKYVTKLNNILVNGQDLSFTPTSPGLAFTTYNGACIHCGGTDFSTSGRIGKICNTCALCVPEYYTSSAVKLYTGAPLTAVNFDFSNATATLKYAPVSLNGTSSDTTNDYTLAICSAQSPNQVTYTYTNTSNAGSINIYLDLFVSNELTFDPITPNPDLPATTYKARFLFALPDMQAYEVKIYAPDWVVKDINGNNIGTGSINKYIRINSFEGEQEHIRDDMANYTYHVLDLCSGTVEPVYFSYSVLSTGYTTYSGQALLYSRYSIINTWSTSGYIFDNSSASAANRNFRVLIYQGIQSVE